MFRIVFVCYILGLLLVRFGLFLYHKLIEFHPQSSTVGAPLHRHFNIDFVFLEGYGYTLMAPLISLALVGLWSLRKNFDKSRIDHSFSKISYPAKWLAMEDLIAVCVWFYGFFSLALGGAKMLPKEFSNQAILYFGGATALSLVAKRLMRFFDLKKCFYLVIFCAPLAPYTVLNFILNSRIYSGDKEINVSFLSKTTVYLIVVSVFFALVVSSWLLLRRERWAEKLNEASQHYQFLLNTLIIVIGSSFVYLFHLGVAGDTTDMDLFHGGEQLASAALIWRGAFPWRDLLFIHGFFADPFVALSGFELYGPSQWAQSQIYSALFFPLGWALLFVFFAYAFRSYYWMLLFCLIGFAAPDHFWLSHLHHRFLFLPLLGLLFLFWIKNRSLILLGFLVAVSFCNFVIVPETIFFCFAMVVTFVACLATDRRKIWSSIWIAAVVLLIFGSGLRFYLDSHQAWDAFLEYFTIFSNDHKMIGGLGYSLDGRGHLHRQIFYFVMQVTTLLMGLRAWYRFRNNQKLWQGPLDYIWMLWLIFAFLYLRKFLSRADDHLFQSYSQAVILIFFLFFLVADLVPKTGDRDSSYASLAKRFFLRFPAIILAMVMLSFSPPLFTRANHLLGRTHVPTATKTLDVHNADSFVSLSPNDKQLFDDLTELITGYAIFDFSNSPGLFYFALGFDSPTRFFHVSMAATEFSQDLLLGELAKSKPQLVAYYGTRGLPHWDGIANSVRHYDISEFILRNYDPLLTISEYVFFARKGLDFDRRRLEQLQSKIQTDPSLFQTEECDWGRVPLHFQRKKNQMGHEASTLLVKLIRETPQERIYSVNLANFDALLEDYSYLEFSFEQLETDAIIIANSEANLLIPKNRIVFETRDEINRPIPLHVAACFQWFQWKKAPFFIQTRKNRVTQLKGIKTLPEQGF